MTDSEPGSAPVEDCFFCRRRAGGEENPVGGWVYEDEHFLVGHGFPQIARSGSMLLESRRHVLDPAGMTAEEAASLAAILPRLYRAMHESLGAERVYLLSTEAYNPHFHAWLYPWRASDAERGMEFLAEGGSCTPDEAHAAAAAVAGRLSAAAAP